MSVDRAQLQILIRDLGAIPPAVHRTLRPAVLEAGRPILAKMRANASWSTRIPAAISMRASGTAPGVQFRVSAAQAPHARPYEGLSGAVFRAPLWGDREWWYDHAARPFFYSAAEQGADEVADRIGDAVMGVAAQHGF
jgi:hypothetical protein